MIRSLIILMLTLFLGFGLLAQTTTVPALPVANKKLTITFDSSKESRLGKYTGDLYAHTGVRIQGKTDWQYVIGNWGDNSKQPKLTHKGNGIYEFEIAPDINTFYSVPGNEKITEVLFVFRSSDSNKQTNDLSEKVYEEGFVVRITKPENSSLLSMNQPVTISAVSSLEADMKLFVNETLIQQNTGKTINKSYTFTEAGDKLIVVEASAGDQTIKDTVKVVVIEEVINEPKPAAYKKGINYLSDSSAALVLWAPFKNNVFVLGDFNRWEVSNQFQMKKDGDYFWLEVNGLEKGKEYIFQYLIDGIIQIADPYTEKTSDPYHDQYISDETYPNLIDYPHGKASGVASVLQAGQEEYQWESENPVIQDKNNMVIYEMLIRDFTDEHSYKSIREKLDYLEDLRINVLELMPVNEFEGNSSWGYNPSFYFAPDKYYGPKNELKKLIDECHKRGIAVVIDMVLNHSQGQSPFVQMYMDNWTISDENPWYNIESPNPVYSWGYDFNHESEATKELLDSVNSFWIHEYKVDGFRFDFTKGFTNTPGDGGAYDQSRIDILKRMAAEIRKRKSDALIFLEHFTDNSEETILANDDMFLWANLNFYFRNAAAGKVNENTDLGGGYYWQRNWDKLQLITFAESHDEERVMYECLSNGKSQGNYNTRNLETALERKKLNALFLLPTPGPKMIWQFGELGYDYSINYCEDGTIDNECRTHPKPIRWDYIENSDRTDLFQTYAKLNFLKQNYEELSNPTEYDYDLHSAVKWYSLSKENNHVFAVGNFDIKNTINGFEFPQLGKYYEFFSGDSLEVNVSPKNISLKPGEFKLYSTRKLAIPDIETDVEEFFVDQNNINIFPNPADSEINVESSTPIKVIRLYSLTGRMVYNSNSEYLNHIKIPVSGFLPGMYLVKIKTSDNQQSIKKIIIE